MMAAKVRPVYLRANQAADTAGAVPVWGTRVLLPEQEFNEAKSYYRPMSV